MTVRKSLAQQEEYRVRDRDGDREPRGPQTKAGRLLLMSGLTFHSGRRLADFPELVADVEAEAALLARPVEPDPDDDELERLARAATPGPWYQSGPPWFQDRLVVLARSEDPHVGAMVADTSDIHGDEERTNAEADAAFIAAANPATVLALLARRVPGDRDAVERLTDSLIEAVLDRPFADPDDDAAKAARALRRALAADSRPEQPAPRQDETAKFMDALMDIAAVEAPSGSDGWREVQRLKDLARTALEPTVPDSRPEQPAPLDVVKGRYYPEMPPGLSGETDEQYTDRLTGADGTDRRPYDHDRNRQCSIGYHGECSDPTGTNGCECPCHRESSVRPIVGRGMSIAAEPPERSDG